MFVPRLMDPNNNVPQLNPEQMLDAMLDESKQTGFNEQIATVFKHQDDIDLTQAALWLRLPDPCVANLF
jgi:hypothetical protein